MGEDSTGAAAEFGKGPMPLHGQLFHILSESERGELLEWAIDNQALFKPAKVYRPSVGNLVDTDSRMALKLREFGPSEKRLRQRLMALLPQIMECAGYRGPPPLSLDLELNAYGDGAHFNRHIDVLSGHVPRGETEEFRILTAVYYFYKEPKGFNGGALRLFRFGVQGKDFEADDVIAYEPVQNSLVAFSSIVEHDVAPVECRSGRFCDFRFGLNCWFSRDLKA